MENTRGDEYPSARYSALRNEGHNRRHVPYFDYSNSALQRKNLTELIKVLNAI